MCLLTETFHPEVGGGETQGRLLAAGLVALGHSVLVLTRRSRRELARRDAVDGVPVLRIGPAGTGRLRKWGLLGTALPALLAAAGRWDVVVVSGFRILGVPAVTAARLLRRGVALKADSNGEMSGAFFTPGLRAAGLRPRSLPVRAALRLRNALLRRADAFVAISEPIERELREAGVERSRIRRIPNGVDTGRFRPAEPAERRRLRAALGVPVGAPTFAYVGRLVSYKGVPVLLRAWREVCRARPGPHLLLVGGGSADMHNCEPELRRFVREEALKRRVTFAGPVEDVVPWLRAADAFVFPSEEEAFGLALVEAMACGLPSVTTAAGGLGEIAAHRVNALVVPPADGTALRRAMETLLDDPGLAARLGETARRTAVERYGHRGVAAAYSRLLTDLDRRRGGAWR